jgi:NAD(P)-dependent dehydrogenase (short-subunit alcohol dehydrogenase family)
LGKYGITVNAICPGYIETPIQDYLTPQEIEDYKASLSIKRLGRPRDIANATLFLASQESEWITGTSLIVDGGSLASV